MDDFLTTLWGIANADYANCDKAGRDTIGDYTIDTCETPDFGWETALWKGSGDIVIVARYTNKEEAIRGHQDWMNVCNLKPTKVWSVQLDEYVTL